jgi:hypothetical protein
MIHHKRAACTATLGDCDADSCREAQSRRNLMSAAKQCSRTALLAAIAVACLGFSGVAQAAAPPDPNTVGATTLSHIELNGVLATELTVAPGADVKIKANWEDNNTACPECLDFVATAFAGNPVAGCIENLGQHRFNPTGSGEVDLGPAPKAPGTYNVVALFEETFSCAERWNASESTGYQVIARITVPTTTTTCGKTTIGKSRGGLVQNLKRVNACKVPFNALISELTVYLGPTAHSGSQLVKGIVYADNGGQPGALLGQTEALAFKSTNAAGWYQLAFATPLEVAAGNYWIGIITGATNEVASERYDSVSGAEDYNTNKYTSGPSNPFGSFKTASEQMSLYATFTTACPTIRSAAVLCS